jgi:hypothetical protein
VSFGPGNFLVTWSEHNGASPQVFAARVTPGGSVLDPGGISFSRASDVTGYVAVASNDTNWLVAWDQSGDSVLPDGVYATRVNSSGVKLDTQLINLDADSGDYTPGGPALAYDGTNYLAVWGWANDTAYGICGSRFTRSGVRLDSTEIQFPAGSNPGYPQVAASPQGSFVIWPGDEVTTLVDGARVTFAGVLLDSTALVVAETGAQAYCDGATVVRAGAGFVASWDNHNDSDYRVWSRRITLAGALLDTAGISTAFQAYQTLLLNPNAATDGANLLETWLDDRTGVYEVYGARATPAGAILDPAGIAISKSAANFSAPVAAFDGHNYLVAWARDYSDTATAVCAARVTPAGVVLDSPPISVLGSTLQPLVTGMVFDGKDYLVAWNGYSGQGEVAGATRITPAGAVLDTAGLTLYGGANAIDGPVGVSDGADWFLTWADNRSGVMEMYAARVDTGGKVYPANGLPICTAPGPQGGPGVLFDGTNYVAFWYGQIGSNPSSLYLARITPNLVLLDTNGIGFNPAVDLPVYTVITDNGSYVVAGAVTDTTGANAAIQEFRVRPSGSVTDSTWVAGPTACDQVALSRSPDGNLLLSYRGYVEGYDGRVYHTMRPWGEFGSFTGASERPGQSLKSVRPEATIIHGVLMWSATTPSLRARGELLDICGRNVMTLHPGANDVSHLAPGVYFVREQPQASGLKPQAVRKIVIQR